MQLTMLTRIFIEGAIMKLLIALTCLLLAAFASPAFAHHGNECANTAATIKDHQERTAYTKDCLARAAAHENSESIGQREKEATCDQNAKNQKMEGDAKFAYLRHCYQENDFNPNEIPDPRK
jgi:hypothetical protein